MIVVMLVEGTVQAVRLFLHFAICIFFLFGLRLFRPMAFSFALAFPQFLSSPFNTVSALAVTAETP